MKIVSRLLLEERTWILALHGADHGFEATGDQAAHHDRLIERVERKHTNGLDWALMTEKRFKKGQLQGDAEEIGESRGHYPGG